MTPEQKQVIDRSRAYGLMRGACEALLLRLPTAEREPIAKLIAEADALWGSELTTNPAKATT